jgi:hypothetical protein
VLRPLLAAVGLAVALTAGGAGSGSAVVLNSDPASHVLPIEDVFLPGLELQGLAGLLLWSAVDRVYDAGDRIKVAVIPQAADLGGMGALWNQPARYAKYLGDTQLRPFFLGPLLIVMPVGFGIYDGGRSTAVEHGVLARVRVGTATSDALAGAAARAVSRLHAAGTLGSQDVLLPRTAPYSSSGRRGEVMKLYYTVLDDSDYARIRLWVTAGRKRLATFRLPLRRLHRNQSSFSIEWRVPRQLPRGGTQFCAVARDASGNTSPTTCTTLSIR